MLDLQEVDLPQEAGYLSLKLPCPFFKRMVTLPEGFGGKTVLLIEAIELVHFRGQSRALPGKGLQEFLFLSQGLIPLREVRGHLLRIEEEASELLVEDPLQVNDGDLVEASSQPALTHILRRVRGDVHLPAARAEGHAGEEMYRRPTYTLRFRRPLCEVGVALIP
ncbi:MAG TPA: hypothetical protein VGG20_26255 [Thermoanaerobaculia bacterium]